MTPKKKRTRSGSAPIKKAFEQRIWDEVINAGMDGGWIDLLIAKSKKDPDAPFSDTGAILEAMLAKGVSPEQICRVVRFANYESAFATLSIAGEEGLDAEQMEAVHEDLLMADPSGKEGRPGSWPIQAEPQMRSRKASAEPSAPVLLPKAWTHAFSPDGTKLCLATTTNTSGSLKILDFPSLQESVAFDSLPNLRSVAFFPDGKRIAVGNHDGVVAVHDCRSGASEWKSKPTKAEIHRVLVSPDGKSVLSSGFESMVRCRDSVSGREGAPLDLGKDWQVDVCGFSSDGKRLLVLGNAISGNHLSMWDWPTSKETDRLMLVGHSIGDVTWVDEEQVLVQAYTGVSMWDLKARKSVRTLPINALKSAALNANGSKLGALRYDDTQILEFPSGKLVRTLETKKQYPSEIAFSPKGDFLLLVAEPKSFLWEVAALLSDSAM